MNDEAIKQVQDVIYQSDRFETLKIFFNDLFHKEFGNTWDYTEEHTEWWVKQIIKILDSKPPIA